MNEIVGTWRLVRSTAVAADGTPLPPPFGGEKAMGRLVLSAEGRMMSVICDGRPVIGGDETREYRSYCGNYTFDGEHLVTRVDAASDPARLGTEQVRDVHFEGEMMVLRPPLTAYGEVEEQREVFWRRIADE